MKIVPVHPDFGARIESIDLTRPLDPAAFQHVFDAFQQYSVLVFTEQRLTDEQQMAFSRCFGSLETTIRAAGRENRLHPNLVDLSNLDSSDAARHQRVMRRTTIAGEGPTAEPPYATRTQQWDGIIPDGGGGA